MARITVYTDDGREVASMALNDNVSTTSGAGWKIFGLQETPLGWLGRALEDARVIQRGGDPERPSEKVMRMLAERGQA